MNVLMSRQPKGQPNGGQFSATSRDESRTPLTGPGREHHHDDPAELAEREMRRREALHGPVEDPSVRAVIVDNITRKITAQEELYEAWKRGESDPADDERFEAIWDGESQGMSAVKAHRQRDVVRGLRERFESGQMTEDDLMVIRVYGSDEAGIRANLERSAQMWDEAIDSHGRSLSGNQALVLKARRDGTAPRS